MLAFNIYVIMNHLSMDKRQRSEKNLTSKSGNDKQPVNLSYKQLNKMAQHSSMYKGTDKPRVSKHHSMQFMNYFLSASAEKIENIKCLGQWCFSVIYILLDSPHVTTDHASFSTHQAPSLFSQLQETSLLVLFRKV